MVRDSISSANTTAPPALWPRLYCSSSDADGSGRAGAAGRLRGVDGGGRGADGDGGNEDALAAASARVLEDAFARALVWGDTAATAGAAGAAMLGDSGGVVSPPPPVSLPSSASRLNAKPLPRATATSVPKLAKRIIRLFFRCRRMLGHVIRSPSPTSLSETCRRAAPREERMASGESGGVAFCCLSPDTRSPTISPDTRSLGGDDSRALGFA